MKPSLIHGFKCSGYSNHCILKSPWQGVRMLSRSSRRDEELPKPVTEGFLVRSILAIELVVPHFTFWDALGGVHVGHIARHIASQKTVQVSGRVPPHRGCSYPSAVPSMQSTPIFLPSSSSSPDQAFHVSPHSPFPAQLDSSQESNCTGKGEWSVNSLDSTTSKPPS